MSSSYRARGALGLFGIGLAAASISAVATERGGQHAPAPAPAAPAFDDFSGSADPVEAPAPTHASRLALFEQRVAAFRLIEPRYWSAKSGVQRSRRPRPVRLARLTPGELRAAMGKSPSDCLAQAVYYEARGEPAAGQAAVAQVVVNRARSGLYPKALCDVVFQGAERPGCQFSFACDGSLRRGVADADAWSRARAVADAALGGTNVPGVASALNYHADYVSPSWAQRLARVAEIGRHIFYGVREGVRPAGALASDAPPPAASVPSSG